MKVRELMTSDVAYCLPTSNLAQAATIMWQRDCGVVPVVDEQQLVVGMITDRDICMAVTSKNRLASEILVSELVSGKVKSCQAEDDVEDVLKTMKKRQLRRLPVIGKDNVLLGIISISDLLIAGKGKDIKKRLLIALREISSFRPVHLHEIAAENEKSNESDADSNQADKVTTEDERQEKNERENLRALEETADDAKSGERQTS